MPANGFLAGLRNIVQQIAEWLSGYDFFITNRRREATNYARALVKCLRDDYRCFLDDEEYAASDDIVVVGNRALKESSWLLLVASPGIADSDHVKREIQVFRSTGRPVVSIGFGDSFNRLRASDRQLFDLLPKHELHFDQVESALGEGPSPDVLEKIRKSLKTQRKRKFRNRAVASFLAISSPDNRVEIVITPAGDVIAAIEGSKDEVARRIIAIIEERLIRGRA